MIRMCSWLHTRQTLSPRLLLSSSAPNYSSKQSIESKLGIPEKPKRPMTPFLRYLNKIRPSLQRKHPDAKVTEISKIGAQLWWQVNPSERAQLEEDFKKDLAAYSEILSKYNEGITPEQKKALEVVQEEAREGKERREIRKKLKDLGKPTKPPSAFILFLKERISSRGPSEDYKAFQQRIAKEWTALDDMRRSTYMEMGTRALQSYQEKLALWEEEMMRRGLVNLVPRTRGSIPPTPTSSKSHK